MRKKCIVIRHIASFFIQVVVALSPFITSTAVHAQASGPIEAYGFNESAIPLLDSSGNNLDDVCTPGSTCTTPTPVSAPSLLRVSPTNGRYFENASGSAVLLTGSHTWANFMDAGPTDPPEPFFTWTPSSPPGSPAHGGYSEYLTWMQTRGHNFFRLWTWEQAKWNGEDSGAYYYSPLPYQRTGPGLASDGKPKFDLTQLNQEYFDRMRARIIEAGEHGMYVSVMLFDGWSVHTFGSQDPWSGHPYKPENNINGLTLTSGNQTHTLAVPAVTALQDAYVRKVIDTTNDLDNVLYEVSNESFEDSEQWQYHMIDVIKSYEASKPKQHPVGMTAEWPDPNTNIEMKNSQADWISLNGNLAQGGSSLYSPPVADGAKVIISDTDHLCGLCGDRRWVWRSFTRGENPIWMDTFDGKYSALYSPGNILDDSSAESLRYNMGYALDYAQKMNLKAMTPQANVSSTGYALANAASASAEFLIYKETGNSFTVNLTGITGTLTSEWLNPETGIVTTGPTVSGGTTQKFVQPFGGYWDDAVLYLKSSNSPKPTPSPKPSGLVLAYGFNTVAQPLTDSSGMNHTGSCVEGSTCPTYSEFDGHTNPDGSPSGGYNFAGSGNYIEVPIESDFDFTTAMTASFWMKATSFPNMWESFLAKGDTAWGVSIANDMPVANFTTFYMGGVHDLASSYNLTTNNAWHHVAVTYDGAVKRVYIDGNESTNSGSQFTTSIKQNNLNLRLGYNQEFASAEYSGWLDDVRVYNRALSQSEILADLQTPIN